MAKASLLYGGLIQVLRQISRYPIKKNLLLNTRASTMQRNLFSVTHCSFHLSTSGRSFPRRCISTQPECFLPISSSQLIFSVSFSCSQNSVDLLHLPDDLLLEDRQDGVIVTNLLEHHTTVKLVAHFLKVEPVVALFGKQLLELAQSHNTAFD